VIRLNEKAKELIKKNTDSKDNEISSSGSGEKTKPAEKKKEIEETGKRSSPGISSNLADNGNKKKNSWKDGSGEKPNLKKTDNSPQKDIRPVLFWGAIIIVILAIVAFLVYCLVGDEEEKEENVNEESKKDSKINKENNNQKKKRRKKEGFK
jgi:hypothetical protein